MVCPHGGADLRSVAFITAPAPVERIPIHLGAPAKPLPIAPARGPPG